MVKFVRNEAAAAVGSWECCVSPVSLPSIFTFMSLAVYLNVRLSHKCNVKHLFLSYSKNFKFKCILEKCILTPINLGGK